MDYKNQFGGPPVPRTNSNKSPLTQERVAPHWPALPCRP